MLKTVMTAGMVMTLGSGYVAYDYSQQASAKPGKVLMLNDYRPTLPFGAVDLMAKPPRKGIASLPQVSRGMSTASVRSFQAAPQSTQEQIDAFVEDSPQLKAMLEQDRAASKERWWARIRQKVATRVEGTEPVQTNRLSALRERNYPTRPEGMKPEALSGQSMWQLFSNRSAIQQGLSNEAANRMNDAMSAMKEMGVDTSVYRDFSFD